MLLDRVGFVMSTRLPCAKTQMNSDKMRYSCADLRNGEASFSALRRLSISKSRAGMEPMNWNDLRFFVAVAKEGTLSGAARCLGKDHTTVSRRIEALEADLELEHQQPVEAGADRELEGEGQREEEDELQVHALKTAKVRHPPPATPRRTHIHSRARLVVV